MPLTPDAARERALRALSRREHSARELARKLTHGGLDAEHATGVVEELSEAGWQSDARYAGLLVRSRVAQGYGPLRIRAELASRGVDEALIRGALADADADWCDLACRVHDRRFAGPATSPKERASRYRYLAARGFPSADIVAALGAAGAGDDEAAVDDDPLPLDLAD